MIILINSSFEPEKIYTLNVLLKNFLGIKFEINFHEDDDIVFVLKNGKKLILKDYFFKRLESQYYYTKKNTFPISAKNYVSKNGKKIVVLYGEPIITYLSDKIICHIDILASSFFMLTRWEEYTRNDLDKHKRFKASNSVAYKFGFLHRPVVNEYVVLLWEMLKFLGITQEKAIRKYTIVPTHDVDLPKLWWNKTDFLKSLVGAIIKRKSLSEFRNLMVLYKRKMKYQKDPFDTFDFLMDLSEKSNVKSHFFFMSGGTSSKDNYYKINDPFVVDFMEKIKKRGHHIGMHPSYNTYNNLEQFQKEKEKLELVSGVSITTGRQHFLRFENPITWQVWNQNNMTWDSTMTYADQAGFRCGVCYSFNVFDILKRKELNLQEKPLIIMDGTLVTYQKKSISEAISITQQLKNEVKKYDGDFVFLWHNSAFATNLWKGYIDLLKELYV